MDYKYLLFSSVGDSFDQSIISWFNKDKKYDIIFSYYGNSQDRFDFLKKHSDNIISSKGSKYQNFVKLYLYFNIFKYDYVWLVDDDIILDYKQINKMFAITSKFKLDLAQPSMDPTGQNSHLININEKNEIENKIRYTDFIEIGCPIISKNILNQTFKTLLNLENKVIAMGIDYYWQQYHFNKKNPNFAVLLMFIVRNPYPNEKNKKNKNKREIITLKKKSKLTWQDIYKMLKVEKKSKSIIKEISL